LLITEEILIIVIAEKQSNNSTATLSDQKSQVRKSSFYLNSCYETLLKLKDSFIRDSETEILAVKKNFCKTLLSIKQKILLNTLFNNCFFHKFCEKIENKNKMRVICDVFLLITSLAEILITQEIKMLKYLMKSMNAGWNKSISFEDTHSQSDYFVRFQYTAFSKDQLKKLNLKFNKRTYFVMTEEIYFSFLMCEVKCENKTLDVADC